jgi:hypothetical protein
MAHNFLRSQALTKTISWSLWSSRNNVTIDSYTTHSWVNYNAGTEDLSVNESLGPNVWVRLSRGLQHTDGFKAIVFFGGIASQVPDHMSKVAAKPNTTFSHFLACSLSG